MFEDDILLRCEECLTDYEMLIELLMNIKLIMKC